MAILSDARRRRALAEALDRVLEFDTAAAQEAAALAAARRARGRPVDLRDTLVGGIATARRATLATRNVRHFADLTVPVVDPWAA